jgi:hypothetical protein
MSVHVRREAEDGFHYDYYKCRLNNGGQPGETHAHAREQSFPAVGLRHHHETSAHARGITEDFAPITPVRVCWTCN